MTPKELAEFINRSAEHLARWRAEQDPDWVEAYINLIDALSTMIRVDKRMGKELLDEEAITRKQYDGGMREVARMQKMLDKLESHEIDPTLYGTIKE